MAVSAILVGIDPSLRGRQSPVVLVLPTFPRCKAIIADWRACRSTSPSSPTTILQSTAPSELRSKDGARPLPWRD
jgi:hypothetical protein